MLAGCEVDWLGFFFAPCPRGPWPTSWIGVTPRSAETNRISYVRYLYEAVLAIQQTRIAGQPIHIEMPICGEN